MGFYMDLIKHKFLTLNRNKILWNFHGVFTNPFDTPWLSLSQFCSVWLDYPPPGIRERKVGGEGPSNSSTPRAFSPWIPNLIEISTLTRSREEFLDVLMSTGLQSMIFLSHQPARCSAKQPPNDAILCVRLDFVDRKPLKTRPCLVPSTKKDSTGEAQRRTITTQLWLTWDESSDTYCLHWPIKFFQTGREKSPRSIVLRSNKSAGSSNFRGDF